MNGVDDRVDRSRLTLKIHRSTRGPAAPTLLRAACAIARRSNSASRDAHGVVDGGDSRRMSDVICTARSAATAPPDSSDEDFDDDFEIVDGPAFDVPGEPLSIAVRSGRCGLGSRESRGMLGR